MSDLAEIAFRKTRAEAVWSLLIICVIALGLTVWIVVPSMGYSLQSGLADYANEVATYIMVNNNGNPLYAGQGLSASVLNQIKQMKGVAAVYPVTANTTSFLSGENNEVEIYTAVIGGNKGFPLGLLLLTQGVIPTSGEAGFVANTRLLYHDPFSNSPSPYEVNDTALVEVAGVRFNATLTGFNAFNPLLTMVGILWNPSFLTNKLGPELYNQTFGGDPNFVIVKAASINDVEPVASNLRNILGSYQEFLITYDEGSIHNLQSVEQGTNPLYQTIGSLSIISTMLTVLFVTNMAANRRRWEVGLLITQGWTWRRLFGFNLCYYSALAMIAYFASGVVSLLISSSMSFTFAVFGNQLKVPISLDSGLLLSALVVTFALSAIVSLWTTYKADRSSLDLILREF